MYINAKVIYKIPYNYLILRSWFESTRGSRIDEVNPFSLAKNAFGEFCKGLSFYILTARYSDENTEFSVTRECGQRKKFNLHQLSRCTDNLSVYCEFLGECRS